MKPKIAIHGNCQASALQTMMLNYRPLLDRFDVIAIAPVHEMSMSERAEMADLVASLDVFIFQQISAHWSPADTEYLLGFLKGQRLELPSMWLNAHMPDITYFANERGIRLHVGGIDWGYHSRLVANCFARGASADTAVSLFVDPEALDRNFLRSNYRDGVAELKSRETSCEIIITDIIEKKGADWRGFHTVNHPCGEIITHAFNQIMENLGVETLEPCRDFSPLSLICWPITASVQKEFGIDGTAGAFLSGDVVSIEAFVEHFYRLYEDKPYLITENVAIFDVTWVNEAVARAGRLFGSSTLFASDVPVLLPH